METLESPPIAGQQTIYDQLAPTHGSLFSGYGGIDIAVAEVFGARTAWVSDIDPGPCTVLGTRFPGVPNLGDITKIDWVDVEPVDILSGGSPCQDLSAAGRRAGMTEGTRSNLWVQMREAIATLRPKLVVWENVMGALSARATSELESVEGRVGDGDGRPVLRALGRVLGDLAEIGFDAEWATVRASDVGAPHGRARVFLIAWPEGSSPHALRCGGGGGSSESGQAGGDDEAVGSDQGGDGGRCDPVVLLPTPTTGYSGRSAEEWRAGRPAGNGGTRALIGDLRIVAEEVMREKSPLLPTPRVSSGNGVSERDLREGNPKVRLEASVDLLPTPDSYAGSRGGSQHPDKRRAGGHAVSVADVAEHTDFGAYAPAVERWELVTGREAPAPTKPSPRNGKPQLSAEFVEWMMGLPAGWVTAPDMGLSRVQQLKALGNGVVPQQAAHTLRSLVARVDGKGVAA